MSRTLEGKDCTRCFQFLPLTEFYKNSSGRFGRDSICKKCQKGYLRTYDREYTEKANQVINLFKETNPCADCNQVFPHYVVQFDHLRGTSKSRGHGQTVRDKCPQTLEKVVEVMQALQVELVCANCHCIRTYERRVNGRTEVP